MFSPKLPHLEDDGLITPEVGFWGETKYRLVQNYASMFTSAMKGKWDHLVYVDLFAGSGRALLDESRAIVPASPLLAMEIDHPFSRYIFCEQNEEKLHALRLRVERDYPQNDVCYLLGDANQLVEDILAEMPAYGGGSKVLGFCFADPYNLESLKFDTLRKLAQRFFDFLVLIPTGMDAQRNIDRYAASPRSKLDDFLGTMEWRKAWEEARRKGQKAEIFLTEFFGTQMGSMTYLVPPVDETVKIRNRKTTIYRLGFYSRHPLARKFFKEARKYSEDQLGFGF
ncbi:three-Cys-motif partner protein [Geothermobacter ehrlichii]|uniref:Three-Cys-motif partner protein n=1 Tax=Geothermobacter ehrlichii TaxID=213224 RepID=A0A5D3WQA1_9BACT|nr:three-Cys-motif partner protein TcmP [Geothermobacter ehrlichii]TYO99979.1 three-Cys-motif partner protein [Geothermobacter ehrlichii]